MRPVKVSHSHMAIDKDPRSGGPLTIVAKLLSMSNHGRSSVAHQHAVLHQLAQAIGEYSALDTELRHKIAIAAFAAKDRAQDAKRPNIAQHGAGALRFSYTVVGLLCRCIVAIHYLVCQK